MLISTTSVLIRLPLLILIKILISIFIMLILLYNIKGAVISKAVQSPPKESIHFCWAEGARWKVGGMPDSPLRWSKMGQASYLGQFLFWNANRWKHKRQKFKNYMPTALKSMGIYGFCYIFQERLPQTLFSVLVSPSRGISKWGLVHFGQT